jgi:hypothetical protein
MSGVMVVVACADCRVFWPLGGVATCLDPAHAHERHELHRHRTVVVLPDGVEVVAVSFDEADPYSRVRPPDFGLYLDDRWLPPWPHAHVEWPDFGIPDDAASVVGRLEDVLRRARAGEVVEIGCLGGHGRTGTALACLAALSSHPPTDAVAWVRANYCPKAVETDGQTSFVAALARVRPT